MESLCPRQEKDKEEAVCTAPSVLLGRWEARSDPKMGLKAGKFVSSWETPESSGCFSLGEKGQLCWRIKWKLICKYSVAPGFRWGVALTAEFSTGAQDLTKQFWLSQNSLCVDYRLTSNSCLCLLKWVLGLKACAISPGSESVFLSHHFCSCSNQFSFFKIYFLIFHF